MYEDFDQILKSKNFTYVRLSNKKNRSCVPETIRNNSARQAIKEMKETREAALKRNAKQGN
ncbi:hypothetical protein AMJ80_11375 [bacterium SM23_31]|nr:MAG: hypothetical protein AMJ80_11375 [bacterium SM23_31]